jgi:hypothetical protein
MRGYSPKQIIASSSRRDRSNAVDVDARTDARLRRDARGRDGGVRKELAAGIDRCRNGPSLSDELMWLSPDR